MVGATSYSCLGVFVARRSYADARPGELVALGSLVRDGGGHGVWSKSPGRLVLGRRDLPESDSGVLAIVSLVAQGPSLPRRMRLRLGGGSSRNPDRGFRSDSNGAILRKICPSALGTGDGARLQPIAGQGDD